MQTDIEWDEAVEKIGSMEPLQLSRTFSDALNPIDVNVDLESEEELDAALYQVFLAVDESPESPAAISYASSDESVSERSVQNSCSSSDYDTATSKRRCARRKNNTGLTVQEKREQRKLRNRELAAESRKRKNDEMDRLKRENSELRARIAMLEKQIAQDNSTTVTPVGLKRTRQSTALATAVAVGSMALFVVAGPSEASSHGLGNSASVLLTLLDRCNGEMVQFAKFIATALLAMFLFFAMALLASQNSYVSKIAVVSGSLLPRRMTSMNSLSISDRV